LTCSARLDAIFDALDVLQWGRSDIRERHPGGKDAESGPYRRAWLASLLLYAYTKGALPMRRLFISLSAFTLVALVAGFVAPPIASAQQSVNLWVGGFIPRSLDARSSDDVLAANLNYLAFNIKDFNGPTFGGEWLVALGNNVEAGLGVGFYTRTAPSVYLNQMNSNGTEIPQDLKLRVVPFTATVRFLPLGRHAPIQPYIGAGVGVMRFRYSETGQFVDFSNGNAIFNGNFVGSGTATGPVVLGGVRFPVGMVDIGYEARYQSMKGDLPTDQGFGGGFVGTPRIDLGGFNHLFTVNIRF
jgi:outer membrane protein W